MSQLNLLKALTNSGVQFSEILSFQPFPSCPRGKKLYVIGKRVNLFTDCEATLLSFINVLPFKQFHWGMSVFFRLLLWGIKNYSQRKVVYLYNLSRPPAIFAYCAARLVGAKIAASLFDIGIPGEADPNDIWQRLTFRMTKWLMPRLDGRIVITEAIIRDFAPASNYLHVDGAVTEDTIMACGNPAEQNLSSEFVLAYAGSLWPINGIDLILEAFSRLKEPTFRLYIAGDGMLRDNVVRAAKTDNRIMYKGMISQEQVLEMFQSANVLLNIRLTSQMKIPYLFPSKLLEYFATGKVVITTAIAHVEKEYGKFCYVLKNESPEALANLIQMLHQIDEDKLKATGLQAQDYIRNNKTWVQQGKRIANYLDAMVKKN